MRDSVFLEGIHYIRPFSGRKVLYICEAIEEMLLLAIALISIISTRMSNADLPVQVGRGGAEKVGRVGVEFLVGAFPREVLNLPAEQEGPHQKAREGA